MTAPTTTTEATGTGTLDIPHVALSLLGGAIDPGDAQLAAYALGTEIQVTINARITDAGSKLRKAGDTEVEVDYCKAKILEVVKVKRR